MRGTLVLDGTPRSVVAICRSLHRRGVPAFCARFSGSRLALLSNAVRREFLFSGERASFASDLAAVLRGYDIDTIVPCSDRALSLLIPYYDEISQLALIASPQPHILARVLDKAKTLDAARRSGVAIPKTTIVSDARDWAALARVGCFPVVVKPATVGTPAPFKTSIVYNAEQLRSLFETLPARAYAVQEYVRGDGVGVSTIVRDGKPLVLFQHRRIHEYPASGGVGVLVESEPVEPTLGCATTALLRELEWRGPAMVEFRHDRRSGDYALMEVNGRLWGSLALSMQAGIDFPFATWQLLHGLEPRLSASYAFGVRTRWTAGEIQRFADLPSIKDFAAAFAPRTRSALFSWLDPLPEVVDDLLTCLRVVASKTWRLALKLLPRRLRIRLTQLRTLAPPYRRAYLERWMHRSLRVAKPRAPRLEVMHYITLVCRANRIRSPLAAAMLESAVRKSGQRLRICSAGTQALPDAAFDPRAEAVARSMDLTLTGKPQAVTADLARSSDILIAMDRIVEAELLALFPWASEKVYLVGDIVTDDEREEVPDPDKQPLPEFLASVERLAATVARMARVFS